MHVLIIGCGYLGLRAARVWIARQHAVTALTRSPDRANEWANLGINPVLGDVMEPNTLAGLPEADACLYAVGFDRSGGHEKRDVYVNGLRNVLRVIEQRIPRLIFISSSSVYGQDQGEIVDESSPTRPLTEGGRICLEAEQVVREFYPEGKLQRPAVILRLAGIYGPGRLIGRIDQLRQRIPISANPRAWLNLIHVDDAVQAVLELADEAPAATTFLLSDNHPLRRGEFYETLARLVGAPAPVFESLDEASLNKRCDSSRILRELGIVLRYPTASEGLRDALGPELKS
jgi:nucleoside-diphosphate-sugar epimerase